MITDEEIQKALDWLIKNAKPAAKARADRIYLEEYRKSLKARLMKDSEEESVNAQEREAYAHEDYRSHLAAIRTAVQEDEEFRWLQVVAEAKIEAWRSFQANARAQGKI